MNANTKKSSTSQVSTLDDLGGFDQVEAVSTAVTGSAHDDALSGDKVSITIYEQEGEMGREAVFVSVNGVGYQIPRDVRSSIPVEVLHALENCVQDIHESLPTGEMKRRSLRRFNFIVHGQA